MHRAMYSGRDIIKEQPEEATREREREREKKKGKKREKKRRVPSHVEAIETWPNLAPRGRGPVDLDDDLERGAPRARNGRCMTHKECPLSRTPLRLPLWHTYTYIYIYIIYVYHSNRPSTRGHYTEASTCDGIAVTAYDSIQADYVLDNVCLVQTRFSVSLSLSLAFSFRATPHR